MFSKTLITFSVSLVGFWFFYRTVRILDAKKVMKKSVMTKIGTSSLIFLFTLCFFIKIDPFLFWFLSLSPSILLFSTVLIICKYREQRFEEDFLSILERMILIMRSGVAFRPSFEEVIRDSSLFMQGKLLCIYNSVVFSQHFEEKKCHQLIGEILMEFSQVDKTPHRGLQRLQSFREKLKMKSFFRRRSVQMLLQIRIQAALMALLYTGLLIYIFLSYGFQFLHIMFLSFILFICGSLWILRGGKRYQWKI